MPKLEPALPTDRQRSHRCEGCGCACSMPNRALVYVGPELALDVCPECLELLQEHVRSWCRNRMRYRRA